MAGEGRNSRSSWAERGDQRREINMETMWVRDTRGDLPISPRFLKFPSSAVSGKNKQKSVSRVPGDAIKEVPVAQIR